MNKNIDTLKDIRDVDNLGFMLMQSTRLYNGLLWKLIRRLILNQERRITALEKELQELKK
jgi:hypothetical protein